MPKYTGACSTSSGSCSGKIIINIIIAIIIACDATDGAKGGGAAPKIASNTLNLENCRFTPKFGLHPDYVGGRWEVVGISKSLKH